MYIKQYFEVTKFHLDTIVAICGIFFGLATLSVFVFISPIIYLITFGIPIFFASFFYLIFRKTKAEFRKMDFNFKTFLILELLFFISFLLSFIILNKNEIRPLEYFLMISLCATFIGISILGCTSKLHTVIQIVNIFLLSLNIKYSIYYYFGGIPGVDSVFHAKINHFLALTGFIDVLPGKEVSYSLMHIQVALSEVLLNTNIKDGTNFAILIPVVLSSIFVFIFAQKLFGGKIGLFALLIVNITDFHIVWASFPSTTSFGVILYYFALISVLYLIKEPSSISWIIIFLITTIAIIFTHPVPSFIFFITVSTLFVGSFIYKYLFDKNERIININFILVIGLGMLLQSMIASYGKINEGQDTFFNVIIGSFGDYLTEYSGFLNRPESHIEYVAKLPPFFERFIDTLGLSLILFLAISAILFWLSLKYRNKILFSIILCIFVLLGITLVFPLFGMRNFLPFRWFIFEYFFLSIMAGFTIYMIMNKIENSISKIIILSGIFLIITFSFTTSTISNLDSPLWLKNTKASTTFTIKEYQGALTLSQFSSHLLSDSDFGSIVLRNSLDSTEEDELFFKSVEDFQDSQNKVFIWREYMLTRPIQTWVHLKGITTKVPESKIIGRELLYSLQSHDYIYDNGEVKGFLL